VKVIGRLRGSKPARAGLAALKMPARRARLAEASLVALALGTIQPAGAQDATWLANPGSGDFNTAANWNPATVPTGTATFGTSATTALTLGTNGSNSGWTFSAGASNYTFDITLQQSFTGAGIIINGGSANINNIFATLNFTNNSTAGNASITNGGVLYFSNNSTAGTANISNGGPLEFRDTSTAGNATITNYSNLTFYSSAGSATIFNDAGNIYFHNNSTAANATISNTDSLYFNDNSTAGSAAITNDGTLQFVSHATAGSSAITNNSGLSFINFSTAGSATITNNSGGSLNFLNSGTAGNATITNNANGYIYLRDSGTFGSANVTNNSFIYFYNTSTAGTATVNNSNLSTINFNDNSTAGSATIANNGYVYFYGSSTAGNAAITSNRILNFQDSSTAGTANITNTYAGGLSFSSTGSAARAVITNNGVVNFNNTSTAANATITNSSSAGLNFYDSSTAADATIVNNGSVQFASGSTAGNANIINNSNLYMSGTAGSATIVNNSYMQFSGGTAGTATITNYGTAYIYNAFTGGAATIGNSGSIYFNGSSTAGNAAITNTSSGVVDFSSTNGPVFSKVSAGSIAGGGMVYLGRNELTVGSNNLSTAFSGILADGGVSAFIGGSLVKAGTGTLTLSGINTYTGATTVDAGALVVNGSIAASSGVTVNNGGTLAGTGTVGATTVASGGALAAGNSTAGSSLNVAGSLALQSGAFYMVQINPATSSFANVTGAATLGGSTVKAIYGNGSYVAKQYTILTAGSVSGTFASVAETNLPPNFHSTLSYDTTHAYLNLVLNFVPPPGSGLSGNQNAVGNAFVNFFNSNGGISLVYSGLTAGGLTQAAGETATGSQQTTFQAMTQFMGLLTDPFSAGRETGASAPPAYADSRPASSARDAYAMLAKAPIAKTYDPRWSVWAAGFGGSQTTDGNTAQGSNSATSRLFGTAAGAEYLFSAQTLAGFALAGGGTNFSVTGGGTGRSDLFQAGAYFRHSNGPSYISAALAYGWQDVTTDRTVTLAGVDHLRAEFNANAWSGRLEGGYRLVAPWVGGIGLTPYAAGQFTTFDLPAYAETVVSGGGAFALAYGAKSVTDPRSELGLRTDKSFAMQNGVLTLRGRAAWAHDFDPDRAVGATFQALPGASFVVNGARAAADSVLTTVSAEMKWLNGWSAAASFEGEFSNVTRSYAGKGALRYAW
jgi:autotransporter-associated beta strand protein